MKGNQMYQILKGPSGEISYKKVLDDGGLCFLEDINNPDWREYQEWLADGNTPGQVDTSANEL
jgi:hypothetical protein